MRTLSRLSAALSGAFLLSILSLSAQAQSGAIGAVQAAPAPDGAAAWTLLTEQTPQVQAAEPWIRPTRGQALSLDLDGVRAVLGRAPLEGSVNAQGQVNDPLVIVLPDPEGVFQRFAIFESPIMEPGLAAEFPQIKTYVGVGLDDPYATLRADVTYQGFHAQVLSPRRETPDGVRGGAWYIDPYSALDSAHYTSYFKRDLRRTMPWTCTVVDDPDLMRDRIARIDAALRDGTSNGPQMLVSGTTLRTYRLANACTGEYAAFHGGTVALAQSAIVTAINRVTGVYEVELAIRMVLVANNSSVVYTNAGSDPYTNSSGTSMLSQNQSTMTSVITSANYDIGHVFSTGGGGVAGLGVVCVSGQKARGVTGSPSPTGDPFWIDYVAHEMGHQFGGNHTFNGDLGNCGGNRNASTAYEPGSGSTIMAYAGICSADNLQSNSDPYFSFISHQEIITYVGAGGNCSVNTSTGNAAPTVSATGGFTIPGRSPFLLTATGSDSNGDALTYCWEQRDTGGIINLGDPDNGASPLFRSFNASTNPTRYFPQMATIIANTSDPEEVLPTVNRASFKFRVTARDNKLNGGGVNSADVTITVAAAAGPFNVTAPATNATWAQGTTKTVTWDVAGTTANGVNCANVSILLSTDGGVTFPVTILASTPNDGSETITVPSAPTTNGRVMVRGVGNIFFDVAPGKITLTGACTQPTITTQPANASFCAGQTATLSVVTGGSTPQNFQWRKGGTTNVGTNSSTLTIPLATVGDSGSYDCVVTNDCGTITSNAATLTINAGVGISSQPPSNVTACTGQPLNLSVTATGAPTITYQWRKDTVDIPGATSNTYQVLSTTTDDAGSYTCLVSNGCTSVLSNASLVTTPVGITFGTQPTSLVRCAGQVAAFSVSAGGNIPITYQWRKNGIDIPGATSTGYLMTNVSDANEGTYDCVVSNPCGAFPSNAATLTVNQAPTIDTPPSPVSVCSGQPAAFAVVATGASGYQWRRNTVDIGGATSSTYSIPAATSNEAGSYDCVVSSSCGSVTSSAAALSVNSGPSISQGPSPQTACIGQPASFSVNAAGSGTLGFQWRKNTVDIGGATSSTYSIPAVAAGDVGSYDCVVTNTCGSSTSSAASLTVNSGPSIDTPPQAATACVGQPASLSVMASGSGTITYQWRKDMVNIGGATSSTLLLSPVSAADAGSYDCVVTNACGSQTTTAVALTVNQPATFSQHPTAQSSCDGGSASFSVMASGSGTITYQWRKDMVNIGGATSPTLLLSPVSAADAGSYDCVATNSCGPVPSNSASLTVDSSPLITTQPQSQSVCSGSPLTLSVVVTGAGTPGYQWRKGTVDIGGATSSSFMILSVSPSDAGSYDCVVTASCGVSTSDPAVVTVDEPPVVGTQPSDLHLCVNANGSFSVAATGTMPLTYQWRKDTNPISGATGDTLALSLVSSLDDGLYDCVVTNICGSTTSNSASASICAADFDCNQSVSVNDLFAFLAAWFNQSGMTSPPTPIAELTADVDRNAAVSVNDLFAFLGAWFASSGSCP